MKILPKGCSIAVLVTLWCSPGFAELWPTLEDYVGSCVVIVKAEHIGEIADERSSLQFRMVESWVGEFDPKEFLNLSPEGYFQASQGEHGVRVTEKGQKIVFFFTPGNQPPAGIRTHSTAFPIKDGKIVYASTNSSLRQEFSESEFKKAILELTTPQTPKAEPQDPDGRSATAVKSKAQ